MIYMHVCQVTSIMSSSSLGLQPTSSLQPARLLCPWDSSGRNTGVGCHGIFLVQGSNLHLLHCSKFFPCSHLGSHKGLISMVKYGQYHYSPGKLKLKRQTMKYHPIGPRMAKIRKLQENDLTKMQHVEAACESVKKCHFK